MIFKLLQKIVIIFIILLCPIKSFSWNALGHMVIANIAYERLKPNIRTKIDELVDMFSKEYSSIHSFIQLGPWPDDIRMQKIEVFTHWHYIDIFFSADGTPIQDSVDPHNVNWAINEIEPIIENSKTNVFEKARFLAFLVHFVGDIHQPLHTVSRISYALPHGDRGGNLYYIKYPSKSVSLHKVWDMGFQFFNKEFNFENTELLTQKIIKDFPESAFDNEIDDLNPSNWVKEGYRLATQFVYDTPEHEIPSNTYVERGTRYAERQAALAGYRLARILNQIFE